VARRTADHATASPHLLAEDGEHRAEDLLAGDAHLRGHVRADRRLDDPPGPTRAGQEGLDGGLGRSGLYDIGVKVATYEGSTQLNSCTDRLRSDTT
jgi:hypothetical protein